MKFGYKVLLILPVLYFAVGCDLIGEESPSKNPQNIKHENRYEIPIEVNATLEEKTDFEDEIIPWISIENPEPEIARLRNANEVVLKKSVAILVIDYPLNDSFGFELKASSSSGFTRAGLVRTISKIYHEIYNTEEETATIKTIPREERKGIINRNSTNGKYGIWGHDLSDLDLSGLQVLESDNKTYIFLMVES